MPNFPLAPKFCICTGNQWMCAILHPHQHLVLPVGYGRAILVGVQGALTGALICIHGALSKASKVWATWSLRIRQVGLRWCEVHPNCPNPLDALCSRLFSLSQKMKRRQGKKSNLLRNFCGSRDKARLRIPWPFWWDTAPGWIRETALLSAPLLPAFTQGSLLKRGKVLLTLHWVAPP